ncbi:MAG: hypothetical protein WCO56_29070, partial [Verrucomicrobiota bacterium]
GKLDIAMLQSDATYIYRNTTSSAANTAPTAPGGLSATLSGSVATLSWNASGDSQTPAAGLTYNLRVGTGPGKDDVFSGLANTASGFRKVAALGNVNQNTNWNIAGLLPGTNYYWSVQAIDSALAGGAWAAEGSFRAGNVWFLTVTAGANGVVTPSGTVLVPNGGRTNFTLTPATYYHVADVTTNGVSVGAVTSFTWSNVVADGTISASFAADQAANGTPHGWLASFGWTNNFSAAETNDTDGDGIPAWKEYIANTNPTNAASVFHVESVANPVLGTLTLTFQSSSNRVYSLGWATNLENTVWYVVPGQSNIPGTGGLMSLTDTNNAAAVRFNRVRVALP